MADKEFEMKQYTRGGKLNALQIIYMEEYAKKNKDELMKCKVGVFFLKKVQDNKNKREAKYL